jgi:hypothetical protein
VTFLKLLPMAFVMIAGPQVLSAVFLATSERWAANSLAYVGGAAVSITAIVTAAYLLGSGARDQGASDTALFVVVLVLLLLAALRTYLKRAESRPPKWIGKLQSANPGLAFKLGFLLLGVFPTDILTSVAAGTYAAGHDEDWWQVLPFIGLTLFLLASPSLLVVALGERAKTVLPAIRDWMNTNSWVVNEVVLAFFVAITLSDIF